MAHPATKWFPTSICTFPPQAIPLGQVISNPRQPHRALLSHPGTNIAIDSDTTTSIQETFQHSASRKIAFGAWSETPAFLGMRLKPGHVAVEFEWNDEYKFQRTRREQFEPSNDFIDRVRRSEEVRKHMKRRFSRKPVFVVTGLLIGQEGKIERKRTGGVSTKVPVWRSAQNIENVEEFSVHTEVVLALTLCKIWLDSTGNLQVDKNFTKGSQW